MPFYSEPKLVLRFSHQEHEIQIFSLLRGATHCDLDHEPSEIKCHGCGADLKHSIVFNIAIDGITITGKDCDSLDEAKRVAILFANYVKESSSSSKEDFDMEDEEDDESDYQDDNQDIIIPNNKCSDCNSGNCQSNKKKSPIKVKRDKKSKTNKNNKRWVREPNLATMQIQFIKLKWPERAAGIVAQSRNKKK